MSKGIILSLCEISGAWSNPYVAMGYTVIRVDPKFGEWKDLYQDRGMTDRAVGNGTLQPMEDGGYGLSYSVHSLLNVLTASERLGTEPLFKEPVVGVMMAPPCTDFTVACSRLWKAKDADGRTAVSVSIVKHCLWIKDYLKPRWWVCENPRGRLASLVPEVGPLRMTFDPCHYAGWADNPQDEAYTKFTCLYGEFNADLEKKPLPPVTYRDKSGKTQSVISQRWGGKSEHTKAMRSKTPQGFSRAFASANP